MTLKEEGDKLQQDIAEKQQLLAKVCSEMNVVAKEKAQALKIHDELVKKMEEYRVPEVHGHFPELPDLFRVVLLNLLPPFFNNR